MNATPGLSQPYLFPHGWPEVVEGADPAAAASFSLTNPGRLGWRLLGVSFQLVTDANVANRFVSVDYSDGNRVYLRNGTQVAIAASTNPARFSFSSARGQSEWNTNNDVFAPLLPIFLATGHQLQINVVNVQAADQLSRVRMIFERFPALPDEFEEALRRG